MREIKFRAWDIEENKIITPGLYDLGIYQQNITIDGLFTNSGFIFMQYTGLKDKNGVEIYEGDIVKYRAYNTGHKDVIKYSNGKFHGQLSGVKEELRSNYDLGLIGTLGCEIIGNIYENPEILIKI